MKTLFDFESKKTVLVWTWLSTALVISAGAILKGSEEITQSLTNGLGYCVFLAIISLIFLSKLKFGKTLLAGTLCLFGSIGVLNLIAGTFVMGLVYLPYLIFGISLFKWQADCPNHIHMLK